MTPPKSKTAIALGARARDKITGFEGIVTATASYLTGCDNVLLTPDKTGEGGKRLNTEWPDGMPDPYGIRDALAIMDAAGERRSHVTGLSMQLEKGHADAAD